MTWGWDPRMAPIYVHKFLILFSDLTVLLLLLLAGNGNGQHNDCPESFDCGSLGMIRFPFTKAGYENCGAIAIHGCDDFNKTSVKQFQLINPGRLFPVTKIDNNWQRGNTISIFDQDFSKLLQQHNTCEAFSYDNITLLPPSPFGYLYIKDNITSFKCNRTHNLVTSTPQNFFKNNTCHLYQFYFGPPVPDDDESQRSLASCSRFQLPVIDGFSLSGNPFPFLTDEITILFQPSYYCHRCHRDSKGHCRLDGNRNPYCATR